MISSANHKLTVFTTTTTVRHIPRAVTRPRLGQLEAGVARDGISQFLAQRALLLVVGQLQQVETRRRRRQSADRVPAADVEEALQYTADSVASVLSTSSFSASEVTTVWRYRNSIIIF